MEKPEKLTAWTTASFIFDLFSVCRNSVKKKNNFKTLQYSRNINVSWSGRIFKTLRPIRNAWRFYTRFIISVVLTGEIEKSFFFKFICKRFDENRKKSRYSITWCHDTKIWRPCNNSLFWTYCSYPTIGNRSKNQSKRRSIYSFYPY